MLCVRVLFLSDIHGNLAALEAVLADAAKRSYERVVFLGDALGYGPRPREVLATLRELGATSVPGNHDVWALALARGETPIGDGIVRQALGWQLSQLRPADLEELRRWPDGIEDTEVGGRFRHGSPTDLNMYVDSLASAREAFGAWAGRLAFVGHTHLPGAFVTLSAPVGGWTKHQGLTGGGSYLVPPSARAILNPGSVGQPRDGDPRASYALFDTRRGAFEVVRVPYDVARTQAEIRAAGLPGVLADRLEVGR